MDDETGHFWPAFLNLSVCYLIWLYVFEEFL